MSAARVSLRESGDANLQPSVPYTVKLDAAHSLLLDLVSSCVFTSDPARYAGELLHNELERAFEDATKMRAGVFLRGVARGEIDLAEVKARLYRLRVR